MHVEAKEDVVAELREELASQYRADALRDYGLSDAVHLAPIADAWMDDRRNSAHRFEELFALSGGKPAGSPRILDMAAGCGTFVFYGLLHGYDVWGIDCADWKLEFNHRKAEAYGYPEEWKERFLTGVGESLPFPDDHFDYVSSYQTLEHVQDVSQCLGELVRVTKPGGAIHIQCPDYRGTYEPHYCLPWLPLMPRRLASVYLRLCGRPTRGLEDIRYVTQRSLARSLRSLAERRTDCSFELVDVGRKRFEDSLAQRRLPRVPGAYGLVVLREKLRRLFRADEQVNLLLRLTARASATSHVR